MTLEHFKTLILTFIASFVLMAAGRLVNLVSSSHRSLYASPFYTFLTGSGLWLIVLLFGSIAYHVPLQFLWWGFFILSVLCFLTVLRTGRKGGVYEHYQSQVVMGVLALLPAFIFVAIDTPLLDVEFVRELPFAAQFLEGSFAPHAWVGAWPIFITASLTGFEWVQSAPAVFYLILFSLASTAMLRLLDVKIRWSNLPLVVSGVLISLSLMNPMLELDLALSSLPDMMLAFLLLAAFSPMMMPKQLPIGYQVLPQALILSLLVCVHEVGIFWVGLLWILWFSRLFTQEKGYHVYGLFSAVLLVCLPLITFYVWGTEVALEWPWAQIKEVNFSSLNISVLVEQAYFAGLSLLICVLSLLLLFVEKDKQAKWVEAHTLFIAVMAFVMTCVLFVYGFDIRFSHTQFLMILPIWRFVMSWYNQSALKHAAYKNPWSIGLFILLLFWGAQAFFKPYLVQTYTPEMQHVAHLAEKFRLDPGLKDMHLAVLGAENPSPVVPFLTYELEGKVRDRTALFAALDGDLDAYVKALRAEGDTHVWIHIPDDLMREKISSQLRSDHSYLFELQPGRLTLVRSGAFPHLNYTALTK